MLEESGLLYCPISNKERSLYSLRHYYAVSALRAGLGVYDIARNMGTSVQMIQQYYGKQATPLSMAVRCSMLRSMRRFISKKA